MSVITAAQACLGSAFDRYVPGHPIAGSELSGPTAARVRLFHGKRWLLCPVNEAQHAHTSRLLEFVAALGAHGSIVPAQDHDDLFAEYSHAPHALVFAMCEALATGPHAARLSELAGAGLRDTTRIGASSPPLWTDILIDNAARTIESLDRFSASLAMFRAALEQGDRAAVEAMIQRASDWRAKLESTD